jgi:uncharacterized protein YbaP (TraB family)
MSAAQAQAGINIQLLKQAQEQPKAVMQLLEAAAQVVEQAADPSKGQQIDVSA